MRPRVFVASSRCPRAVLASSRCPRAVLALSSRPRAVLAQSSRSPRAVLALSSAYFLLFGAISLEISKKVTFCVFLIEHVSKLGSVSGSLPNPCPVLLKFGEAVVCFPADIVNLSRLPAFLGQNCPELP